MAPRPRAAVALVVAPFSLVLLVLLLALLRPSTSLSVVSVARRLSSASGGANGGPDPSTSQAHPPSVAPSPGRGRLYPTSAAPRPPPRGYGGQPARARGERKRRLNLGERVGIALAAVAAAMQVVLIGACLALLARQLRQGKARDREEAAPPPSSSSSAPPPA